MSDTARIERSRTLKVVDGETGLVKEYYDDGTVEVSLQRQSLVQPGMSCAAHDEAPSPHHFGDEALQRLVIAKRRLIEDLQRDETQGRGRKVALEEATHDLAVFRGLQKVRLRLRWRYGARDAYGPEGDRGTDVWDHYLRLDEPPSYALAIHIDRQRYREGKRHLLNWETIDRRAAERRKKPARKRRAS